jgi:hypothetical protein
MADTLDFTREAFCFAKLSLHGEIHEVDAPKSVKPSQKN